MKKIKYFILIVIVILMTLSLFFPIFQKTTDDNIEIFATYFEINYDWALVYFWYPVLPIFSIVLIGIISMLCDTPKIQLMLSYMNTFMIILTISYSVYVLYCARIHNDIPFENLGLGFWIPIIVAFIHIGYINLLKKQISLDLNYG